MPVGRQPTDPRLLAAVPQVLAYMAMQGHQQKDVMRLSKQSQPQVSKFLSGQRRRVTTAVRQICRYAGIDLELASVRTEPTLPLSQSARQVLEDNPRAAEAVARVIEALVPVLAQLYEATPPASQEAP
jgi:hypothetical protein